MKKEKAIKIQQYYDYFRLIMILLIIGFLLYITI